MKIITKKRIIIFSISVLGICILGTGIVGIAKNYYTGFNSSQKEKVIYQVSKKEKTRLNKMGQYNPKDIDKEQIEEKAENIAEEYSISVEEAKKIITKNSIAKKALYLAAEDAGITVDEAELTEEINKIRATFDGDEDGQKELKARIAGMGMTENEYWDSLRPQYKSNIMANKYLQLMYGKRCQKEKISMDSPQYAEKQTQWKDEITEEAIKKYHVTAD